MLSIVRKARSTERKQLLTWKGAVLSAALSVAGSEVAEAQDRPAGAGSKPESLEMLDDAAARPADKSAPPPPAPAAPPAATSPSFRLEAGAPRPSAQTPGIAPPAAPPPGAPPAPPVVKVGGAFILAYFQPYGLGHLPKEQFRAEPKANMEVFRAALFLDSKINRFGVHIEFRARDKKVRNFYDGTSWMEETYGSVDLMKPDNPLGPMVLKVGKAYSQFGKFWDDQFYGNVQLRDGLKLDPNYGVSLEGSIGTKDKRFGTKYYGQYFVIDGGTNTSLDGRDTFSNDAPLAHTQSSVGQPRGRRRNMIVGRVEPFFQFTPTTSLKLGGSLQNFTADFGPTMDQQNVVRYGGDITANVLWFSAWGEFTQQKGRHTLIHPFAPVAAVPEGTPSYRPTPVNPTPGQSSDDVQYFLAGGKFTYKMVTLRYHYSSANYKDVTFGYPQSALNVLGDKAPKVDIKETIHSAGLTIMATQQLFLMVEFPIHKRHLPAVPESAFAGTPLAPRAKDLAQKDRSIFIDKAVVVTLHARI